jgi:hypothetical protein
MGLHTRFLQSRMRSVPAVLLAILGIVSGGFAAKQFVRPVAQPALTYPAHDQHADEHVTVAADPYDMPDKAQIFSVNFRDQGIIPIFVVITNDGDQPVELSSVKAQLVTSNRAKISPSSADDIYRRLSKPGRNDSPSYPIPLPRKKVKGALDQKTRDEIQAAMFSARAVEPRSTQSGFMFFDVEEVSTPLAGARLFLTGVRNSKGDELMYFEIPMEKYLSAPPRKP